MPPNAWGLRSPGPKRESAAPAPSAFPELGAAQQVPSTRRTRAAARSSAAHATQGDPNPYRPRIDELNQRATQWRRTGRVARDVVFRDEVERAPVATGVPLDEEERGASMASLVVRDKTRGTSALGAWASLFAAPADPVAAIAGHEVYGDALDEPQHDTFTTHDPGELKDGTDVATLRTSMDTCVRAYRADALERHSEPLDAFVPLFQLVEVSLASPVMLHRLCFRGAVYDDAPLALLRMWLADASLPVLARARLHDIVYGALDTAALHLEAAQRQADKEEAVAVYESRYTHQPIAVTDCALLAMDVCDEDPQRIARIARSVDRRAWKQPSARIASMPADRLASLASRASSALSWRLAQHTPSGASQRAAPAPSYNHDETLLALLGALEHLWKANRARPAAAQCGIHTFYAVATELPFGLDEYVGWVNAPASERGLYPLMDHPYVLSLGAKVQVIAWESQQALRQASTYAWMYPQTSARHAIAEGLQAASGMHSTPRAPEGDQGTLALQVRRDYLVDDSMVLLGLDALELHRPLKITFVDEIAQDAGGLRKEYLLLLCEELCHPTRGLFCDINEAPLRGVLWFAPKPQGESDTLPLYELLGMVLGLALLHQVTLPLRFPERMYASLLHRVAHHDAPACTLDALRTVHPQLASGLEQLLRYEDAHTSVEDAMGMTWSVHYADRLYELAPGGDAQSVTAANREAYATRIAEWMLHDAIDAPLGALARGFAQICAPPGARLARTPLALFLPAELETLLRGRDEHLLDVSALRASTAHVGFPPKATHGPSAAHENLDAFWDVWRALDAPSQHALLGFITGSPRVPAMGAACIGLRIQHVDDPYAALGAATERVPWSSTCTSTLFLPVYPSRAVLEDKVRVALQHSTGFGLG